MNVIALDYQTPARMALKRQAVPLPDMKGKRVLDVGCDAGFWCWLAHEAGAADVLGLDRGREVRGGGAVDIVTQNRRQAAERGFSRTRFEPINVGRQWRQFGRFDVIFVLSVYHHIFEQCADHEAIWFWLWRHCSADGEILWEGPTGDGDPVVRANVSDDRRAAYTMAGVLAGAARYFTAERIGPALHERTREVWRFRPRPQNRVSIDGRMVKGAGGAAIAFNYAGQRRVDEVADVLGVRPVPGSLNVRLDGAFDWESGYLRAQILDVQDREAGFESEWSPRWARFYPLTVDGVDAFAFRFESDNYDPRFVEIIADFVIRDYVAGPRVVIQRC